MAGESTGIDSLAKAQRRKEQQENGRLCFIVGRSGSGKTTLAKMLETATGLKHLETGDIVGELLAGYHLKSWVSGYRSGSNKSLWREELEAMGDVICRVNAGYLLETCVDRGARIVTGIRRRSEMRFTHWFNNPLLVLVKPPELKAGDVVGEMDRVWELEDIDVTYPCIVVRNDGNLAKLTEVAERIALELAAL